MKLARRLLSVLLALLMVFALVACGGTGDTPSDGVDKNPDKTPGGSSDKGPNIQDTATFEPPERPIDEMTGKNYIIIQHDEADKPFGYSQDSNMGLQVTERLAEVMELYGCTLEFYPIPYNTSFASQLQSQMYAENGGDLIFSANNAMLRHALGTGGSTSLCVDLLQVDDIINFWDFNKWGNITAREAMMAGGTFYGVSPALWIDRTPLPYYTVVYNKDMVELAGATDPQEYWENEEWDRYAMEDVIVATTDETAGIWGMTATINHMVRATFLTTGQTLLIIDKINSDGTVDWSHGLESGEAQESFQWLKQTLTTNAKCFNNGASTWATWGACTPFNEELSAMALTRPADIFNDTVVNGPSNFGVITWAGEEANTLTGYYEMVATVAIPLFAKNVEHSAYLMYDIFEGIGDVQTYDDVLAYYGETYFNSDIDLTCLVREGAKLQYSYWPNGVDSVWTGISDGLLTSSSISNLIGKYVTSTDKEIEEHVMPNQVALAGWKELGYFD